MEISHFIEEPTNIQKENLQLIFDRTRQAAALPPNPSRLFRDITHKFVPTEKPLTKSRKTSALLSTNLSKVGVTKNVLRA